MVRRILGGGLLGAVLGLGLGLGVAQVLRVATTPTLSALFAAGVGAAVFVFVRRPPWRQESIVESLLRTLGGMLIGAGLWFLAARFVDATLPFAFPPVPRGARLTEHPVVFGAALGFVVGTLVGVEPTPTKAETPRAPVPKPPASPTTA